MTDQQIKNPNGERQMDDNYVICPFCESSYLPEGGDFNDNEHEEECDSCGMIFLLYDEISVTHHTYPRKIK